MKGFRSLQDVELTKLGAFSVFYGPNGSGKSNVLNAIATFVELVRLRSGFHIEGSEADRDAGRHAVDLRLVRRDDLCVFSERVVTMTACIEPYPIGSVVHKAFTVGIELDWVLDNTPLLRWSSISVQDRDAEQELLRLPREHEFARDLLEALRSFPDRLFGLVDSDRYPHEERRDNGTEVVDHLRAGHLKQALFVAQTHPDVATRSRFRSLRQLLMGEPLKRPSFDVVQDPRTGEIQIREQLDAQGERDVPLELAGLGIAQIYSILANVMLRGTRAVGIEEPEAHLHARTTGLALRKLLVRLVAEHHIDQLFIATHSNLFDLDDKRYLDVRLEGGRTVVRSLPLDQIDRDHLYEPGPAKHALKRSLEYLPPDETVFRRPDGAPVSASEMLHLLQIDDEAAVQFLEDVHGAAVGAVRVKAKHQK